MREVPTPRIYGRLGVSGLGIFWTVPCGRAPAVHALARASSRAHPEILQKPYRFVTPPRSRTSAVEWSWTGSSSSSMGNYVFIHL
eukprot:6766883-Pyramimonas_sp.AAC.1